MAATRASEVATNVTSASTTWNINVGSPSAGQLIIVGVRFASAPGTVTFSGYTVLAGPDTSDAADDTTIIYYRWADGTEGTTDTLSPTNSVKGGAVCFLFNGAANPSTQVPEFSTVQNFTTSANTANPQGVTPTGGTKNYAFCAIAAMDGESTTFSALSGYTNFVNGNSGTSGLPATNCIIGGATRSAQVSSEDPGNFTHGAAQTGGSSWVIAIHPANISGQSIVPITAGVVTAGKTNRVGQIVAPFTVGITTAGTRKAMGQSIVPVTVGVVTSGFKSRSGQSIVPVTFGVVTSGKVVAKGQSSVPLTLGISTAGKPTVKGQSVVPLTLGITTNGTKVLVGQSIVPLALGITTSGIHIGKGQVVTPLALGIVTSGDITGGAETFYGTSLVELALGAVTSGYIVLFAYPVADSVDNSWTDQDGGSALALAIDEQTASDADYIRSPLAPSASACRLKLQNLSDPNSSSGHSIHWRIAKDAADGNVIDMTVRLYQGGGDTLGAGTLIASFGRSNVSNSFVSYEEPLSGAQADSISDYSSLYVEFEGTVA